MKFNKIKKYFFVLFKFIRRSLNAKIEKLMFGEIFFFYLVKKIHFS